MRTSLLPGVAASAALLLLATPALAQDAPVTPPAQPASPPPQVAPAPAQQPGLHRNFGFGTAFGAGVVAAGAFSPTGSISTGVLPAVMLPTFEAQFFIDHKYSIDVSIPVTNIVIASAVLESFVYATDVFFNFNVGTGNARMVIGPGLGFSFIASGSNAIGSIRIPAEIGLEAITNNEAFGFKVLARPWVEFVPTRESSVVGGGALLLLGFSGYLTD